MMRIGIPVTCQNGHKAKWIIEIDGLNVYERGVSEVDKCRCPKWDAGQGYTACGEPEVLTKDKP